MFSVCHILKCCSPKQLPRLIEETLCSGLCMISRKLILKKEKKEM